MGPTAVLTEPTAVFMEPTAMLMEPTAVLMEPAAELMGPTAVLTENALRGAGEVARAPGQRFVGLAGPGNHGDWGAAARHLGWRRCMVRRLAEPDPRNAGRGAAA